MGGHAAPKIRRLEEGDMQNGFLESLDSLSVSSDMDESRARGIFRAVCSDPNRIVLVAELNGRVVGTATVLIDQKFIHDGGRACHIEDVAVSADRQGAGIGASLIRACLEHASKAGCYKTTLMCSEEVVGFYRRLGFRPRDTGMRFDHDGP